MEFLDLLAPLSCCLWVNMSEISLQWPFFNIHHFLYSSVCSADKLVTMAWCWLSYIWILVTQGHLSWRILADHSYSLNLPSYFVWLFVLFNSSCYSSAVFLVQCLAQSPLTSIECFLFSFCSSVSVRVEEIRVLSFLHKKPRQQPSCHRPGSVITFTCHKGRISRVPVVCHCHIIWSDIILSLLFMMKDLLFTKRHWAKCKTTGKTQQTVLIQEDLWWVQKKDYHFLHTSQTLQAAMCLHCNWFWNFVVSRWLWKDLLDQWDSLDALDLWYVIWH